jgi:hypothetical protein
LAVEELEDFAVGQIVPGLEVGGEFADSRDERGVVPAGPDRFDAGGNFVDA